MTTGNLAQMTSHQAPVLAADPERERLVAAQAGMIVHGAEPLNCETPPASLGGKVTSTAQAYRRCHFQVPLLDEASWRLGVSGMVGQPMRLSMRELSRFPAQTMAITLECAGNDRARFQPPASGVPWGPGAVSTAEWTGPRLADVLRRAGIRPGGREVIFGGADGGMIDEVSHPVRFERSMPVADAMESDALLAYAMNGRPLPAGHGYPLRLVVPGWYAMASVKWLTDIRVTDEPFSGFFQDAHYVYERGTAREPVRLQHVRALITRPGTGQEVARGVVIVRGVAWSGAAPIGRVDVSVAGGPWQQARLVGAPEPHGWQEWEFLAVGLGPGEVAIRARASDMAGREQPERPEWNRLGYGGNFIHEIRVAVR
jgi:DMSO/TMAO reductase YedYZ molybdopterin-dependent catalytic subunit